MSTAIALVLFVAGCGPRPSPEPVESFSPPTALPPVRAHKADEIPDGFRGDSHPLLEGDSSIDLVAKWSPTESGRALELGHFPEHFYKPFRALRVSRERRSYPARQFSAFLPPDEDVDELGRMWKLDLDKVIRLLKQFNRTASWNTKSFGRRAGPDGGFAMIRATSPTHCEIAFRFHAEFEIEEGVYYTPAHFSGTLVLDKKSRRVERFQLAIPDDTLNVTLTVALSAESLIDIIHVKQMELQSVGETTAIEWAEEIEAAEAAKELKQAFFGFLAIDWKDSEEALSLAKEQNKPILAVVLWGSLDNQSC